MPDCECLVGCPFFNDRMANMPVTAEIMKRRICRGQNDRCARYRVFKQLGREHVPSSLFPHNLDLAEELIAAARKED